MKKILLYLSVMTKYKATGILILLFLLSLIANSFGQATVFSDDFSTNTSADWTTSGQIGASNWSVLRSGDDWGARRNTSPQQLELTNDVGTATNLAGWIFASTPSSSFSSPYSVILEQGGVVSWTFNMRQIRPDPEGFDSGSYGVAFILAGETASGSMDGNGYAVVLGQPGNVDPVRLVSYTDGIMGNSTLTNLIVSNTSGLTDFGIDYLSIKVTFNPCQNNEWELFVRNDGNAFVDPLSGTLVSQGTVNNSLYTGIPLNMMAGYWQGSIAGNRTAFMDNVTVQVTPLPVVEAGIYGPVCTNDPDVVLTGTPAGGIWSGIGVTGNNFNPNAGTQTLTYSVTDLNECFDSDSTTITVNPCLSPPEMRWILLEEAEQNGSCISISDCDDDVICYALQYTPNMTGNLTSYTTGFIVDCNNGANPIISNSSCVMNSATAVDDQCALLGQVLINASGNGNPIPITQGVSLILHQVCFSIPSGSSNIIEDEVTDLTTSIDSINGPAVTEYPSYVTTTLDSTLDCSILPLRFLSFTAARYDELKSQLDWITVDEINNAHFEIQRSTDGGASFQPIGIVPAHSQPRAINHYRFIDEQAKVGQNYYRLKQVDLDDRFQYSPVRNVFFGAGAFSVTAWPNPVAEYLNVKINHAETGGLVKLVDISGREVLSEDFGTDVSEIKLMVSSLMPGAYTLTVTTGSNRFEEKIVVVKN